MHSFPNNNNNNNKTLHFVCFTKKRNIIKYFSVLIIIIVRKCWGGLAMRFSKSYYLSIVILKFFEYKINSLLQRWDLWAAARHLLSADITNAEENPIWLLSYWCCEVFIHIFLLLVLQNLSNQWKLPCLYL